MGGSQSRRTAKPLGTQGSKDQKGVPASRYRKVGTRVFIITFFSYKHV